MEQFEIYNDISVRTGGDIYLGVVGPVRTGKSTFISKFMNLLVLPAMQDTEEKNRALDELPQSAAGKTIMTTEPKFVPNNAVKVTLSNKIEARFRLVDCVGYVVENASGATENGKQRLVNTPWSADPMPFDVAAEMGTKKVIDEHSTIAILVTTDGTISGIERKDYVEAEEKVVEDLKSAGKPFVIVLNTTNPTCKETMNLKVELETKYNVGVLPLDVQNMDEKEIASILQSILYEFPITKLHFNLPKWTRALDYENSLIQEVLASIKGKLENCVKMKDLKVFTERFEESEFVSKPEVELIKFADGSVYFNIQVSNDVFYKLLSEQCGIEIQDEFCLMSSIKGFAEAKKEYDKIKEAFVLAKDKGYGIVAPREDEMTLEAPEIMKKGGGAGVKLKASAPSYHIMRVDVETEVSPAVGVSEQNESFNKYLMGQVENNPAEIWNTNMFGKPLSSFVQEGIVSKIANVPEEAQVKMRKTMTKIVNEGKGGIICILL